METIRRYPNRKLYSETTSRSVTLQDLSLRILQGLKFRVYSPTGEDITRTTLATILTDLCFNSIENLPEEKLEKIVHALLSNNPDKAEEALTPKKPAHRKWTLEACMTEARKYKRRSDWYKGSQSSYAKALKMGWLEECCTHME